MEAKMKKQYRIALISLLCAGVAVPALAQRYGGGFGGGDRYDRIGTVHIDNRFEREFEYGNFGGPVEALRLEARDAAVQCRNIRVTFANGRTRNVFSGRLPENRRVNLDLPGEERNIRRIAFNCRALAPRGSRVDIAADIGRYRGAWQSHPEFARRWARLFPWANSRDFGRQARWVPLGTEHFDGGRDREVSIPGNRGQGVDALAVRPLNADARSRRVTATFSNGRSRQLNLGPSDYLAEDRLYRIDLPGGERNVERIDMTCRAVRGRSVAMQVLALR
jgi:hypothetical protein